MDNSNYWVVSINFDVNDTFKINNLKALFAKHGIVIVNYTILVFDLLATEKQIADIMNETKDIEYCFNQKDLI